MAIMQLARPLWQLFHSLHSASVHCLLGGVWNSPSSLPLPSLLWASWRSPPSSRRKASRSPSSAPATTDITSCNAKLSARHHFHWHREGHVKGSSGHHPWEECYNIRQVNWSNTGDNIETHCRRVELCTKKKRVDACWCNLIKKSSEWRITKNSITKTLTRESGHWPLTFWAGKLKSLTDWLFLPLENFEFSNQDSQGETHTTLVFSVPVCVPWPRMRWRHHFSNSIRSSVCFSDEHGTSIKSRWGQLWDICFLYPMLSQVISLYQILSQNMLMLDYIFIHIHPIFSHWVFATPKKNVPNIAEAQQVLHFIAFKSFTQDFTEILHRDGPRVVHVKATEGHLTQIAMEINDSTLLRSAGFCFAFIFYLIFTSELLSCFS